MSETQKDLYRLIVERRQLISQKMRISADIVKKQRRASYLQEDIAHLDAEIEEMKALMDEEEKNEKT